MDNNHSGLALRRHSIRTLSAPELSLIHGGRNDPPTSGPTDRTEGPRTTKTK